MTEIFSYTACRQVLQLFLAIIFFHVSEYILAISFHGRSNVTLRSLLVSKSYILAMSFALLEYCLEVYFSPGLKEHWWISNFGLAMLVIGEVMRKMAIITAGRAFTHLIKIYHEDHHQLVTSGVYSFVRHPGYCGFFIWSIGSQIMLCNPISTVAFAVVVWNFFAKRIPYEEFFLRQFFGSEYDEYARRVSSGIPFVKWEFVVFLKCEMSWEINLLRFGKGHVEGASIKWTSRSYTYSAHKVEAFGTDGYHSPRAVFSFKPLNQHYDNFCPNSSSFSKTCLRYKTLS